MHITIDHVSAPVIGVLVLLATTTIGGDQVKQGIVGEDGIEPYDVLALFISLAYIAISLDATGLLRFLAFLICLKAGRQGREAKGKTLYLLLYFFFWGAGVLVGNDPVILSGTAFLVYFTPCSGDQSPRCMDLGRIRSRQHFICRLGQFESDQPGHCDRVRCQLYHIHRLHGAACVRVCCRRTGSDVDLLQEPGRRW